MELLVFGGDSFDSLQFLFLTFDTPFSASSSFLQCHLCTDRHGAGHLVLCHILHKALWQVMSPSMLGSVLSVAAFKCARVFHLLQESQRQRFKTTVIQQLRCWFNFVMHSQSWSPIHQSSEFSGLSLESSSLWMAWLTAGAFTSLVGSHLASHWINNHQILEQSWCGQSITPIRDNQFLSKSSSHSVKIKSRPNQVQRDFSLLTSLHSCQVSLFTIQRFWQNAQEKREWTKAGHNKRTTQRWQGDTSKREPHQSSLRACFQYTQWFQGQEAKHRLSRE